MRKYPAVGDDSTRTKCSRRRSCVLARNGPKRQEVYAAGCSVITQGKSCMTFAIPKTRCFAAAGASLLAVSALFERARIKQTFLQVLYAGTLLLQVYPEIACRRFVEIADSRSSSVGFTPRRRLLCIINIIIHHAIIFYDDNGV